MLHKRIHSSQITMLTPSVLLLLVLLSNNLPTSEAARRPTNLLSHSETVYDPSSSLKDHESTYNWPAEEDAMVLAHNAIRNEVANMKEVVENMDHLESWKIESIQAWWKGHEAHVRYHCKNEQDHLHPAMSERFEFPVDKMREDHTNIYEQLDEVSKLIRNLKDDSDLKPLSLAWSNYMNVLLCHFSDEEAEGVVSVRKAFTSKEWGPIVKGFFDKGAKEEFGSFIYSIGEERFRNHFMRQRKIPGFVWRLAFKKNLTYYRTSMVKHMDDLQRGHR